MKICVVIPIYNESIGIGTVVESLLKIDMDVIVVDDGSTDQGGDIAMKKGAKVFRNPQKLGKGFSLRLGFQYAMAERKYDGVIAMDGDGQHSVRDIETFLNMAQSHADSVITGNRMTNVKGMPLIRVLTNRFMSSMISMACRQRVADTQCGYRYIGANVLKEIQLTSNGFEIETEILMKASKRKFPIYSVPIATIYENEQSHIHPIRDTYRFFVYFLKELFSSK